MNWNAPGMEPGGEPLDYAPPFEPQYPASYGTQPPYDAVPDYGSPSDDPSQDDRSDPRWAANPRYGGDPRSGHPGDPRYAAGSGYAPGPGYAADPRYAPGPGYPPDPRYAQDDGPFQPEYGALDADEEEELPAGGRAVTPLRLVAIVALVVSGVVAAVSLLVLRGDQSIAITVASLAIFGLMATLVGVGLAASGVRAARAGSLGRSVLGGLFGGLFVLVAAGAVASAVIFLLLSRP